MRSPVDQFSKKPREKKTPSPNRENKKTELEKEKAFIPFQIFKGKRGKPRDDERVPYKRV